MEEFVKAILAAERKLKEAFDAKKPPLEAKAEWSEAAWRARTWLPADPQTQADDTLAYLEKVRLERLKKVKGIPDVPDSQKSPERRAMEAAGFFGARGPDEHSIAVCRKVGELLEPVAHYWHKRIWWNLVRPPKGSRVKQGRGMAELLKVLKENEKGETK